MMRQLVIARIQLDKFLDFQRNLLLVLGLLALFVPLVLIAATDPEPLFGWRVPFYWSVVRVLVLSAVTLLVGGFLAMNNQPDRHTFSYGDVANDSYSGNSPILAVALLLLVIGPALMFGINIFFVVVAGAFMVVCLILPRFHEWGRFLGTYVMTANLVVLTAWICIFGAGV
jgi:hypothetical protein